MCAGCMREWLRVLDTSSVCSCALCAASLCSLTLSAEAIVCLRERRWGRGNGLEMAKAPGQEAPPGCSKPKFSSRLLQMKFMQRGKPPPAAAAEEVAVLVSFSLCTNISSCGSVEKPSKPVKLCRRRQNRKQTRTRSGW